MCDVLDLKKKNKATKKSTEQLEANSSRAGTFGVAEGTPVVEVDTGPERRTAQRLLLCRQEGAEELCPGPLQKGKMPAPRQDSGRKHAEHKVFYTSSPTYISLVLSFLLYSVCIYAWRAREALQTPIPLLQHTGTSSPRLAGVAEIPPLLEMQLQLQSSSSPTPPSPRGTDPSWLGAVGQQQEEAPAGSAKTRVSRFSPQTSAEHVQGERLQTFIKWPSLAAKWSESCSVAKSQQHGGARAAQIGRYLTVSRQEKLFSFSKELVVSAPFQPHATHTQRSSATETPTLWREGLRPIYSKCLGSLRFQIHPS